MKRVPADLVLLMLHQTADHAGDEQYRIAGATLRSWTYRGRITHTTDGYDLAEILDYLDRRATTGRTRSSVSLDRRPPQVQR